MIFKTLLRELKDRSKDMEELILPGDSDQIEVLYEINKEENDISDYLLGE